MKETKHTFLNVGCGNKFHRDWTNIDMVSHHPDVIEHNILNGLPFLSDNFDVVYHSQVLEHIPKEKSIAFLSECFRVMKPGGIIRIVLPDLENIVNEYKKYLDECLSNKHDLAEANYDWALLEMYDQTVRNFSGGMIAKYIETPLPVNEKYVLERIGYVGTMIRNNYLESRGGNHKERNSSVLKTLIEKIIRNLSYKKIRRNVVAAILTKEEREFMKLGQFRNGGEIHYWMYDRFSLSRLLETIGFANPIIKNPFESDITDWAKYELDVKDNQVYDPTSLFIEARKPVVNPYQ